MKLLSAVLWGVLAALVCWLLGVLLVNVEPVARLGVVLQQISWVVGVIVGIYTFVANVPMPWRNP